MIHNRISVSIYALSLLLLSTLTTLDSSCAEVFEIDWAIPGYGKPKYLPPETVTVGDSMKFNWSTGHNVYIHPNGDCDTTGQILVSYNPGESYTFKDDDVGVMVFVCGVPPHCDLGQIITVTVNAAPPVSAPTDQPSSIPSDKPTLISSPTSTPSSAPSSVVLELIAKIPMEMVVDVKDPPTTDDARKDFADTAEPALKIASGGNDVKVNAVGGVALLEPNVFRTYRAGVNINFDVILKIECDGSDCSSAKDAVSGLADKTVDAISSSLTDGSFTKELIASATANGYDVLEEVTVDAESFSSADPIVDIPGSFPSFSPTTEDSESLNIFQMIWQFLISILDLFPFD